MPLLFQKTDILILPEGFLLPKCSKKILRQKQIVEDKMMNRTQYAIKNAGFGILSKILSLLVSFVSRTVFIYVLGSVYLGVNGLYAEILSLLSFAELGFGSAMTFSMYRPVANNDREKIVKLLNFFKKIYSIIACVIAILGLCLIPLLEHIIKGADWLSINELRLYFLIFLFNTVVGYFVSYKFTYLNALQQNYIQTNIEVIVTIVSNVAQIAVLLIFRNFLLFLIINSVVLLCSRVFITIYLNKRYPILKEKAAVPLSKEEKAPIYKEVKGLAVHQFASAAVHSTDNILISVLTEQGVAAVGLISNYTMLINSVLGFVLILFNSITSGFGNLVVASTTQNFRKVFQEINFANFWIYGFCCIAFWVLIPPFITLWIGADNLIDNTAFTLIIINCYLQGQSTAYHNARIAKGNFNKDKTWALVQAIVNLVVSIVCAKKYGLVGIYIGTIVSRMVYVIFRPHSTYTFLFGAKSIEYYKKLAMYFCEVIFAALITKWIVNLFLSDVTISNFILGVLIVAVLPNLVFLILNCKSKEFKTWRQRLMIILDR